MGDAIGGKIWRWAYRFEGKQKLITFGKYPAVSLARARERHAAQKELLAEGVDLMAQRKAARKAVDLETKNTFT